jgi:hypothetical protein
MKPRLKIKRIKLRKNKTQVQPEIGSGLLGNFTSTHLETDVTLLQFHLILTFAGLCQLA